MLKRMGLCFVIVGVLAACSKAPAAKTESASAAVPAGAAAPATEAPVPVVPGAAAQAMAPAPAEAAAAPAAPSAAGQPASLTPDQLSAAFKAIGVKEAPGGKVINACDEAVTPEVHAADLGGDVGRAWLIVIGGGPNLATCYGDAPGIFLLRQKNAAFKSIFSGAGMLAVLPEQHKGVHDIAIGGPGFEFPKLAWDGTTYANSGTIKDSELPATLN